MGLPRRGVGPGPSEPERLLIARRVIHVVGWAVLAPILMLVLLRLTGVSGRSPRLFALDTLTVVLYVPAYVVLAIALWLRRRGLLAAAAVVVLAHLVWVGPDLRWWSTEGSPPGTTSVTLIAANLFHGNERITDIATSLMAPDPDVLVLTELTPTLRKTLEEAGLFRDLPHRIEDPQMGAFGSGIYSRYPLSEPVIDEQEGLRHVSAKVQLIEGPVTLVAVHTLQPLAGLERLRRQLSYLASLDDAINGPLILAGDFNATRQHAPFRRVLEGRLRDAHASRGRGLARTWPAERRVPPFALLDHVLVSEELVVLDVHERDVPGSDHRAVIATVALKKPRSP